MKFGISIPAKYDEAVEIDIINGNTYSRDATQKEMNNIEVAFKFLYNRSKLLTFFKKITCHLIFDLKFDLTRKSRYIGGVHLTQVPESMSYSSVVSRYSVRIMFLKGGFYYLDINMCDIWIAYINVETRERLRFTSGSKWWNWKGCQVIIIRALYELKSSGSEWKKLFADYIWHTLLFEPCVGADDNV